MNIGKKLTHARAVAYFGEGGATPLAASPDNLPERIATQTLAGARVALR